MVNNISLSQGMLILDEAFSKTRKIMEGFPNVKFTPEEYQKFYECVYLLCVQRTCSENARILYERYKNGLEECINSLVLPSLEDKSGAILLNELVHKWSDYRVMSRWLSRFFDYLDRFYIPRVGAFGLQEQAVSCFDDMVKRFNGKFIAAAISLINQDRMGQNIDKDLLKAAVEYFDVTRSVGGSCFDDFQNALLADAAAYYSHIAANGLLYDSCTDYMCKVQWCLNQESERADHFLDPFMKGKLLQVHLCFKHVMLILDLPLLAVDIFSVVVKSHLVDQALAKLAEKQQAENLGRSADYQELLSKCAGLNLGDRSSMSGVEDCFSGFMLDRS